MTGLGDDVVQHLTRTFYTEVQSAVVSLEKDFAEGNWNALIATAHKVKPGFVLFGVNPIIDLLMKMLSLDPAKVSDDSVATLVGSFMEQAALLLQEMEEMLEPVA